MRPAIPTAHERRGCGKMGTLGKDGSNPLIFDGRPESWPLFKKALHQFLDEEGHDWVVEGRDVFCAMLQAASAKAAAAKSTVTSGCADTSSRRDAITTPYDLPPPRRPTTDVATQVEELCLPVAVYSIQNLQPATLGIFLVSFPSKELDIASFPLGLRLLQQEHTRRDHVSHATASSF
jgi:hypothetical protein